MKKYKKNLLIICIVLMVSIMLSATVFAAGSGDVAGAIEGTWKDASGQIKTVVNKVVFPAIDLILAVFFFAKLGMAYFDFRKHGQFEWAAPAILFACLVFTLTAPKYIWTILGIAFFANKINLVYDLLSCNIRIERNLPIDSGGISVMPQ